MSINTEMTGGDEWMDKKLYVTAKIKKLLALSASPNEHEAQRALAKAQELMLEYQIEEADFTCKNEQNSFSKVIKFWRGSNLTSEAWAIGSLAEEYQCAYDTYSAHGEISLILFGNEADVEIAALAIEYSWKAFRRCWIDYFNKQSYLRQKKRKILRLNYCVGFISGVIQANRVNRTSNALVIVTPKHAIEAKEKHQRAELIALGIDPDRKLTERPQAKPRKKAKKIMHDLDAYNIGYIKGRSGINDKQLSVFGDSY